MNPGDLILMPNRKYKVDSICLGGTGQESVVGLVCYDNAYGMPQGSDGKTLEAMYVPVNMLDAIINVGIAEHYVPAARVA